METSKFAENAKSLYLAGFLIILFGLIHNDTFYNIVDYSIIGIGLIIVCLGILETLKSIWYIITGSVKVMIICMKYTRKQENQL